MHSGLKAGHNEKHVCRRVSALLVIFVLAWLPACSGVMDREKAMDKDKTMVEKSGGTMVIWMVEGRLC